jgi:hypothetical protein
MEYKMYGVILKVCYIQFMEEAFFNDYKEKFVMLIGLIDVPNTDADEFDDFGEMETESCPRFNKSNCPGITLFNTIITPSCIN